MNIPSSLRYTKEHEWVDVEDSIATVGITDWAQSELGDVVFVELPKVGDKVEMGEAFGTIEAVKAVSELFSPVTGTVVEINTELETDPMVVNQSAYERGWMIRVEMSDPDELDSLLSDVEYAELTT
ncbi:MAG TPA: glycine cleavage system protein GcvH [candidate division Zixibacteria bacterium]|nr:glycine cleavage system protein GcvH [candidate division Zixibacteria bacterium]